MEQAFSWKTEEARGKAFGTGGPHVQGTSKNIWEQQITLLGLTLRLGATGS